jgi:hypothetical protein
MSWDSAGFITRRSFEDEGRVKLVASKVDHGNKGAAQPVI